MWNEGDPNPTSINPEGHFVATLTDRILSYRHTLQALGGFWSAEMALSGNQAYAEEWLENGLGRTIITYNDAQQRIWEGFVSEVEITIGEITFTHGPLLEAGNRVQGVYTTLITTTTPPSAGVRVVTPVVDVAESQRQYGLLEMILSLGNTTELRATQQVNTWAREHAMPKRTQRWSDSPQAIGITLRCLGFAHRLSAFVYLQTTNHGQQNLSAQLGDILDASPNSLFSSTNARLTTNTIEVDKFHGAGDDAWSLLQRYTAIGDADENRYLFGVYAHRRVVYEIAPTATEYMRRVFDRRRRVYRAYGGQLAPWDVVAGKWLDAADLSVAEETSRMFIETVTFEAPYTYNPTGGTVDKLPQLVARLGLADGI